MAALDGVEALVRPQPTRFDWRYVAVFLTADEQAALVRLARQERRERSDMAALLIRLALEERGVMGSGGAEERRSGG